jgi:hypothetical protein
MISGSLRKLEREIKKFLQSNENENTTYQNPWDTANVDLRGKFINMSANIRKLERSQINNLMMHLKLLEKQELVNRKVVDGKKL